MPASLADTFDLPIEPDTRDYLNSGTRLACNSASHPDEDEVALPAGQFQRRHCKNKGTGCHESGDSLAGEKSTIREQIWNGASLRTLGAAGLHAVMSGLHMPHGSASALGLTWLACRRAVWPGVLALTTDVPPRHSLSSRRHAPSNRDLPARQHLPGTSQPLPPTKYGPCCARPQVDSLHSNMSNLHAPTVPSGPTTAPATNGRAGHLTIAELQRKKDNLEAELKALGAVLESVRSIFQPWPPSKEP